MLTTLRNLLKPLPWAGYQTHHITGVISAQVFALPTIGKRTATIAAVIVLVLSIIQLLLLRLAARWHRDLIAELRGELAQANSLRHATARRHRELIAAYDAREQALLDELADANTDEVTGLPTRRFIYRHINGASTDHLTVAFCDVDGLKSINDRLSHAAGDAFLAVVAQRLTTIARPDDTLVRLGGDEFALATTQTPDQLAAAFARALSEPTIIAGEPIPVGVSVGIFPTIGGDAHTALGCAEAAMRTAKRRHSFIEHYDATRDGAPLPPEVRPAIRRRDQRHDTPSTP